MLPRNCGDVPHTSLQTDRALTLDVADNPRNRVFRRDQDHRVHVLGHQMTSLDPALLLRDQFLEHLPEVASQFAIQHPATFGNEHNVVFAVPPRVT